MGKQISLKFLTGPIKGQEFTFDEEPEVIIGRIDDCDITLKDPKISSEHCGIFFEDDEYFLEDFESTNGTYVNTTKVDEDEYVLEGGETLFLGSSKISVKISSSSAKNVSSVKEEEFDFEEDTNIKKINTHRGLKKFLDIDYYLDLKEKFLSLDNTKKAIVIAIILLSIILVGTVFSKLTNKNGKGFFKRSWSDDSEKILSLNDSVIKKVMGYLSVKNGKVEDFSHPKKIRFKFKASNREKIIVHYKVTGIEYLDELIIKLNGVKIAKAPLTSKEVMTVKLNFPFENLNFDKENLLEFINTKNLNSKRYKNWGIMIYRIDKRLLPKPDFDKAKENYLKADKFYEQKKISRGNRYKALTYYQAAIDFMELMKEKPDFYYDAREKIKTIQKDFEKIYQDNRYAAIRAFKFHKFKQAKVYINNIIEEIPDEDDSRYTTALKMLNAIP